MPTKIWYVDTTATPTPGWIGPYGTGDLVSSWGSVTKAADNWYFGLGGQTAPGVSFWNNTFDAVRIGSYGDGRHIIDFTSATMPGAPSRYCFRSRNPNFTLEYIHIIGHPNQNHQVMVSDNGAAGLLVKDCILQGPGAAGLLTGAVSTLNVNPATAGDYTIVGNEIYGTTCGMTFGGAVPPSLGLVASNYFHDLETSIDPGQGDCITVGGGGVTPIDFAYKLKIISNRFTGWNDHAFDSVGGKRIWIEGNTCERDSSPNGGHGAFGGFVLGGDAAGGSSAGANFVYRNKIILERPSDHSASVIGINSRYGSANLLVANLVVCETTAFRDEWHVLLDSTDPTNAALTGRDNHAIQCTFVTTGTALTDTPAWNLSGINMQLTNCALIGVNSSGALRTSPGNRGGACTSVLKGCRTNLGTLVSGGGTTTGSSNNSTSVTMPSGPEYFPTAGLLGVGETIADRWADRFGVVLPANLVGGMAPDARTSALPGVTRKWWKGFAKPTAVLA